MAPERWEPQNEQDFVTGVREDMYVELARPRQTNQFVVVGTFVTAPSAAQSTSVTVDSSVGFSIGSLVQIMLDSGENFQVRISNIVGSTWTLASGLPATVGTRYGDPIENSILLLNADVLSGFFVLDSANGILDVNVLA